MTPSGLLVKGNQDFDPDAVPGLQDWVDGRIDKQITNRRLSDLGDRSFLNKVYAPKVTSLPPAPRDGDEILYDTGVNGVFWHFRYQTRDVGGSALFPWRFMGGAPLSFFSPGEDSTASVYPTMVQLNGPVLTVPLRGSYNVAYHGLNYNLTAGTGNLTQLRIGGVGLTSVSGLTTATWHTVASFEQSFDGLFLGDPFLVSFGTVFNAGVALEVYYATTAGTSKWRDRHMSLIPNRVGPAI